MNDDFNKWFGLFCMSICFVMAAVGVTALVVRHLESVEYIRAGLVQDANGHWVTP